MLFGALFVAVIQLAVGYACFALARYRGATGLLLASPLGVASLFVIGICAGGPVQFFQWLALLAVGVVCLSFRLRGRSFLAGSLLATLAVFGTIHVVFQREYARAREQYPFESMTQRLADETRHVPQPGTATPAEALAPPLNDATRARLEALEDRFAAERSGLGRLRSETLRLVHASQVKQFVASEVFGVGRRLTPSVRYLEWDNHVQRPPVAQPAVPPANPYETADDGRVANGWTRAKPPADNGLIALHQDAQLEFVNQDGFGYIKDRDHVAGFVSHGFRFVPELPERERWITLRVELVSILLHDVPMVYVSENLPNMQELDDVEVRPLDAFESQSLDALRKGEDLVGRVSTNRLRMLGSLRATRQCTQCHMVPRGRLLGAFSYEFHRDPRLPVAENEESVDMF